MIPGDKVASAVDCRFCSNRYFYVSEIRWVLRVCVEMGHTGEQPDEVVGDVGDGGHFEGL